MYYKFILATREYFQTLIIMLLLVGQSSFTCLQKGEDYIVGMLYNQLKVPSVLQSYNMYSVQLYMGPMYIDIQVRISSKVACKVL